MTNSLTGVTDLLKINHSSLPRLNYPMYLLILNKVVIKAGVALLVDVMKE